MRTTRAVDYGPVGISSRHVSGPQIHSSRALLQPNGQEVQSGQALVQSRQALVQSGQALVQSGGLLVQGSAGLQVRVAVIKRTRLDPLPSVEPPAAPTVINPASPSVFAHVPHLCLLSSVRHGLEYNATRQDVCQTCVLGFDISALLNT